MKKFICLVLCFVLFLCLFSGCQKSESPDNTTGTVSTTEDTATEPTPPEDSDTKVPSENTEPTETTAPTTLPAEPDTQTPVNTPTTGTPTSPTEPKPTEPKPTEPKPTEPKPTVPKPTEPAGQTPGSKVIAGGKWDGGPVTWEITDDGVLTFAGNQHIQAVGHYIWQDYANIITKVVFKDGIKTIPSNGFAGMTNIVSVQIGSTVADIGDYAFYGCTSLRSVNIPTGTKVISPYAFYGCTGLRSVTFTPGGSLEEIEEYAFAGSGLQEFTAPFSLRTIYAKAFADCTSLTSVRLDGGIRTIRAKAFEGCTGLKHLILGSSITSVDAYIFRNCNALTTLEYNTNVGIDFTNYTQLTKLVIGGTRTSSGCFDGCTSLSNVTFNSNITEISPSAFNNCRSLTSITLPSSLQVIESGAFRGSGITGITIPSRVTKIGFFSFGNTPLSQITFTGNAPSFDTYNSFHSVTATAYYPAENATWSEDVLQNYGGTLTWAAK